jgi:hypothetical protein
MAHQLMFANCVVFVWTAFLSVVCHDDEMLRDLDFLNPFLSAEERARGILTLKAEAEASPETE